MRIALLLLVGLAAVLVFLLYEPGGTPDTGEVGPTGSSSSNQEAAGAGEGAARDASLTRREEAASGEAEKRGEFGDSPVVDIVVVDAETGDPVPGARVSSRDPGFDYFAQPVARRSELSRLQQQDPEAYLLATGIETRTDARGQCRVPVLHWGTQACARLDDRWGILNVGSGKGARPGEEAGAPIELRIGPDHTLCVRVEDPDGRPLAGHKVQVCGNDRSDMVAPITVRHTDVEGRCSFAHTQLWASRKGPPKGFVRAWLPGGAGEELELDFLNPPREEVVLVAIAPGSIVVRLLDGDGVPVDPAYLPITERDRGAPSLRVYAFDERPANTKRLPMRRQWPIEIGEGGIGRLDSVALNRFFAVVVPNSRRGPVLFEGPTRPDQTVTVDVSLDPGMVVLTGWLFAEDEPVSRERVELIGRQNGANVWEQARTDAEGRFLIRLASRYRGTTGQALELHRGPRSQRAREQVALGEVTFRAGVTDLGVLHVLPPRDLIRGRIVYGEGVAKVRPQITCERFDGEQWRYQLFATPEWGDDDTFAFRGSAPDGTRFRLRVQATDALPIDPIEVEAGAGELTISLEAACRLRATFLVDEATPVSNLRAHLLPATVGVQGRTSRGLQRVADPKDGSPSPTKAFAEWEGLESGPYVLRVVASNYGRSLLEREVTLRPGQSEGPRDQDLRGLVRRMDVHVRAGDGQKLDAEGVRVLVSAVKPASGWLGFYFRGARGSLVAPTAGARSMIVLSPGYVPARVDVPTIGGAPVEVTLQPAPRLTVNVVLPVTLPQGTTVSLILRPDGELGRARGSWSNGGGGISFWLRQTTDVGVDGSAVFRPWLDEPHWIQGEVNGRFFIGTTESQKIPAGATTFTFTADAESLRKALERR